MNNRAKAGCYHIGIAGEIPRAKKKSIGVAAFFKAMDAKMYPRLQPRFAHIRIASEIPGVIDQITQVVHRRYVCRSVA
jgi:hypothetical protein